MHEKGHLIDEVDEVQSEDLNSERNDNQEEEGDYQDDAHEFVVLKH